MEMNQMTKPISFGSELIFPCYNIVLLKVEEEILFKIFLESTSRFDYEFIIRINGVGRCCDDCEYHNGYIVFPLWDVPEDENPEYPVNIEYSISLYHKTKEFNGLINPRYGEIIQIHEEWYCEKQNEQFVLTDTNFSWDTRQDILYIHFEHKPEKDDGVVKQITDDNFIDVSEVIDVVSPETDLDKLIEMK